MQKQVVLNNRDYEKIVKILADSARIVDKYCMKESRKNPNAHIMDSPSRDAEMHSAYTGLLNLEDDILEDVRKEILKSNPNYFETSQGKYSVLTEFDILS